MKCDVTSWKDQLAVFKAAIANSPHKSIDIVVANAGIAGNDPVFEQGKMFQIVVGMWCKYLTTREDDSDEPKEPNLKIININLIGVVYTSKLAMHYFGKQADHADRDKCLILKSSLAGYLDLLGAPQYNVSKFGVRGLMCNLRRLDRMRVNLIAPW